MFIFTAVFAAMDSLRANLERLLPPDATGLVIGLSGGLDSSCLATALAELAERAALPAGLPLRAVHVDHGLQSASNAFLEQSAALCRRLGVALAIVVVRVELAPGASVEAAAREVRYAALAGQLERGECLLTAHHGQDQAETFLLQALRGAGSRGLACMPERRALGPGWHLRPLLGVSRRELAQFASAHGIAPIEDPMNRDMRFDRSFLRHKIWPQLERRWPGAAGALARAAQHSADAQQLLDELADQDLAGASDGVGLSVIGVRRLKPSRRLNAMRRWLSQSGVTPPSTAHLTEALRQMLEARDDHLPVVIWGAHALRRYRERIFLTAAELPRLRAALEWDWRAAPMLELGEGLGWLRATERPGGLVLDRLPSRLLVRGRAGGERMRIGASGRAQSVQHLCQDMGILPWMRDALPFIYLGDKLLAIADLWLSASWRADANSPGLWFAWEGAPPVC
jgi:tRNA(Ile)-lysidine synthase